MFPQGVRALIVLCLCYHCVPTVFTDTTMCPAGERKKYKSNECVSCPRGQYQSTPNPSMFCEKECGTCTNGSFLVKNCTNTANVQCKCHRGFTVQKNQVQKDLVECECTAGYGIVDTASMTECKKCTDGYFTDKTNMQCQQWKTCGEKGVKTNGSTVSDVICNGELDLGRNSTDLISASAINLEENGSSADTTTSPSSSAYISGVTLQSSPPDNSKHNRHELGLYSVGFVLLLSLFLLYCKRVIVPHSKSCWMKKNTSVPVCRKPVEECGDSSNSTLVKSCQV